MALCATLYRISHLYFCLGTSYVEIYNERVQDLLKKRTATTDGGGLRVREHPLDGPYVESKTGFFLHPMTTMTEYLENAEKLTRQ